MPTAAECAKIREEEGEDAIRAAEAATTRKAVWVRWHEVPDFHGSGARDRHYVLDRLTGEIRFGDGSNGLIPPRGVGNIRSTRYQTGGGARGNQPAGAITQLKTTVPYVDKVTNLEPAAGGAGAESLDSLRDRAPRMVRHGGRAVTREDYEDLAMLATPEVARAKCVPLWNPPEVPLLLDTERDKLQRPGCVTVIVVPRSGAAKPVPSLELIGRVRDYLGGYSLLALNLFVVGPRYVRVDVEAVITPISLEAASHIEAAVREALSGFLHPLTGGFKGSGWPWGRKPHESDFYRCIESIPGVDHVSKLMFSEHPEIERLTETDHFLVYSGTHKIRLTFGEA
jgi:predicted phage baseplate assembly protein